MSLAHEQDPLLDRWSRDQLERLAVPPCPNPNRKDREGSRRGSAALLASTSFHGATGRPDGHTSELDQHARFAIAKQSWPRPSAF
jgi:hypothetical protein